MTIDDGQLYARQEMDDPPVWRMLFDDDTGPVKVGLIWGSSPRLWRWGIDHQLTEVSSRINGTAWDYETALRAFRVAFLKWMDDHTDKWSSIQGQHPGREASGPPGPVSSQP